MCGIAICLSPDPIRKRSFSKEAQHLLRHRGPDAHGVWEDQHVSLIHTRLAIQDLTEAGTQPMQSSSGRYIITYNGEIYNHLDLRKRFLPQVSFRGHSDTETILALYEFMGPNMLQHLIGMWAVAIWDTVERKLFLSRDRFGQKPLYWVKDEAHNFFFASEIKPLSLCVSKLSLNVTMAVEYLSLGNYGHLGSETFVNEIKSFPPSHYAFVEPLSSHFETKLYWVIPEVERNQKQAFNSNQREFLNSLIREAVLSQTISDVPVGMTLSGGIDSSVIAGVLAKHSAVPIEVFSARNMGSKFDESVFAQSVIDYWEKSNVLKINFIDMSVLSIRDQLKETLTIQEEPFGDPSIMAHLQIMNAVYQKGIKVILSGQGSDEIFYGYNNMFHTLIGSLLRRGEFRKFGVLARQLKIPSREVMRILFSVIAPGLYLSSRRTSRQAKRNFIQNDFLKHVVESKIHLARPDDFYDGWIESIRGVHLPHLVHYDDRNGMSLGIEGRMPFLDHRVIEFLATLKPETFALGGIRKFLLKESGAEFLPPKIKNRQDKIGFFAPLHEMIWRDIDFIFDEFYSTISPLKIVDNKVMKTDLDFYKAGGFDVTKARRIWRVLSLCTWMKTFKVSAQ